MLKKEHGMAANPLPLGTDDFRINELIMTEFSLMDKPRAGTLFDDDESQDMEDDTKFMYLLIPIIILDQITNKLPIGILPKEYPNQPPNIMGLNPEMR